MIQQLQAYLDAKSLLDENCKTTYCNGVMGVWVKNLQELTNVVRAFNKYGWQLIEFSHFDGEVTARFTLATLAAWDLDKLKKQL